MKKLLALVLVLCIFLMSFMAAAEEEYGFYADDNPEAAPYVSTWVAEDGYWRMKTKHTGYEGTRRGASSCGD